MLTPEQIAFYRSNGFLVVENALTPAQVEAARRVVEDFVEQSRAVTAHNEIFDLEPGHTRENPQVRRLKNPDKIHPLFDSLMRSDAIVDCVASLIGPTVRYQAGKLNMKAAGVGSPVEWHQDFAFYPHTNDDLLAVGVYLDDATLENGCMLMIPGSHKGPVLDHHQDGVFVGAISPSRGEVDLSKAVPVAAKAGSISLHHAHILHGSAPNQSARPRRLLLFQYAAVDAWPLAGVADLDTFNKKILRGEPTVVARLAAVPARIPLPGAGKGGSIYELQTLVKEKVFAGQ